MSLGFVRGVSCGSFEGIDRLNSAVWWYTVVYLSTCVEWLPYYITDHAVLPFMGDDLHSLL